MPQFRLEELVLPDVLRMRARTHRGEPFLKFREGELTFEEVNATSSRMAQGLASLGVDPGDHVALMLPNSPDFLFVFFAISKLGAVAVPINTAYRGDLLHHVLDTSDASLFVVDEEHVDAYASVAGQLSKITRVVVRTDRPSRIERLSAVPLPSLLAHGSEDPNVPVAFSDLQAIMYTSGTTGPSKGVMSPHALTLTCALDSLDHLDGWGKNYYCPLPLFHAAALWDGMMAALLSGSPVAIVDRFSASRYWDDIRFFNANVSLGVFSMIPILLSAAAGPDDRDNPLETFYMGKSSLDEQFFQRFGAHTVETYTSTEAGIPTGSPYGEWRAGSCGKENSKRFEVAIVDEHDRELPAGEAGELVIRPREPFVITTGYYGFWEHTSRIFRNQWFHTGDRLYRDEDGYHYFVDRIKDAIRRRGENISAFDLEQAVNLHPAVLESAAIGVPSELQEDDVKLDVVLRPGVEASPADIVAHCRERLPAFMVPRYVEIVDELPRTQTGKIAKHHLRERGDHGLTSTTWDREQAEAAQKAPA